MKSLSSGKSSLKRTGPAAAVGTLVGTALVAYSNSLPDDSALAKWLSTSAPTVTIICTAVISFFLKYITKSFNDWQEEKTEEKEHNRMKTKIKREFDLINTLQSEGGLDEEEALEGRKKIASNYLPTIDKIAKKVK